MANLNLSQFTEKTLVADADWVFVWDTAGAISKKVSRNSLLNSGTLATSAPVTISQTWAAVGQTFTAFTVNAAGTSDANSASGSLLLDLQLNGVSQVNVKKSGQTVISSLGSAAAPSFIIGTNAGFYQPTNTQISASANNTEVIRFTAIGIRFGSNELGFGASFSSNDTILLRDGAANTLALRNGAAAQTFNVYGTYTSGSVYERMFAKYNSTDLAFQIGTETASATLRPLDFVTGGSRRMTIGTTGNVGIGTTAPTAKLEVVGASSDILSLKNAAQSVFLVTSAGGAGSVQISHANSPSLIINQSSGNKITLGVGSNNLQSSTASNVPVDLIIQGSGGNVGIGTTAPSSKLHVAETWNASGTTFAAAKIVVTDTASMAASTLLELWSDAVTPTLKYSFGKSGNFQVLGGNSAVINCAQLVTNTGVAGNTDWGVYLTNSSGIILKNTLSLGWSSGVATLGADTVLRRDDEADHLAMRRTTNGQKFSVYGTYPGAAWERFTITAPTSGNVLLGTYKGTGGIARGLEFQTDGVTRLLINTNGGATFTGNAFVFGGGNVQIDSNKFFFWQGGSVLANSSNGVINLTNQAGSDFGRLQFGGTTASFPALKRSSTTLQVRLADDNAFAPIQGKLTTDTAFTSGAITDTGYIVLYDSTGTAYKVACTPV